MYAIYINTEKLKNGQEWDFVELIMNGLKRFETRNKDVLKRLVGCRVAIVDRNKWNGAPMIMGFVTISRSFTITDRREYERLDYCHLVHVQSSYYWNDDTKQKVFYELSCPERGMYWLPKNRINHGRSYTEFNPADLVAVC